MEIDIKQPILSKYLQKYIIDIIISNINKEKKQLSLFNTSANGFKDLEKVCWYWFELVCDKTNIISYKQLIGDGDQDGHSKYLIFKKENIKYLYIKSCDTDNFSKNEDDEDEEEEGVEEEEEEDPNVNLLISRIKNSIPKYPNLKRVLLIINRFHSKIIVDAINKKEPITSALKQIKVSKSFSNFPADLPLPDLSNNNDIDVVTIDEVGDLNISPPIDSVGMVTNEYMVILNSFLQKMKKINYLYVYGKTIQLLFKQIYNSSNDNSYSNIIKALSNCKLFQFYESPITIEQLYHLLKFSEASIELLSIEICYDNLIHQLETSNDKNNGIAPCRYCSSNYTSFLESSSQFLNQWEFIRNSIINSKKLKHFVITHRCPLNNNLHETGFGHSTGEYQKLESFPQYTIENLGTMFKNNNSIYSLTINSFHTTQLFEFIYNNTILNSNTTIQRISSSFRILNLTATVKSNFIKIANDILLKNNHIESIEFNELDENTHLFGEIFQYNR